MSQATPEIQMRIEISAPIDTVWRALTQQSALRTWFNDTIVIDTSAGGRVEFTGVNGTDVYRCSGVVTAWEPPHRLTLELDWQPPGLPEPTLLTFEIQSGETEDVTVSLRHHGWERLPDGQRETLHEYFQTFWNGDELVPLKEFVEGVGPTH
jgi:uncharacterized protein YndB with AHSA1/START domain